VVKLAGKRGTLNAIQKIPTAPVVGRVVVQPETWYTCPTGQKAIVKGKCVCTGLGAAASVRLNAAGVRLVEWQAAAVSEKVLIINTYFEFEIQLAAGETLDTSQDAGANGEINMLANVQETPA